MEGAQEGSPFSNFFGKIKQLADPNTYSPILEGLSQVSTLSKSFQAELDTIDTDVENALNDITLGAEQSISKISQAGVAGGKSIGDALEKTAEETETFQDRINKALKEGSEEIVGKLEDTFGAAETAIKQFSQSIKEETDKMQAEINKTTKQITELQGTFDTFKERSAKLIIKAQEDEKKLIEEIVKEEERIKQKNEELKKQNAEIQEQNKKTIESGEAKLKELKKEIDVTDRLMKLQDELQQARAVVVTGEDLKGQVDLVNELENARVEATLNPLELLRKEFEKKTGFNVQSIQEEIARLEQVRLELEENLNERRELYNTFFTDIESADGSFTNLYLKRVKERENVTVESINALIKKYNELKRMQQRINQKINFPIESLNDRNEKIRGFSKGGFTGGGVGVVHPNEWVAPSWMVGQLRGVFDQLESGRLGGSRVPVSSSVHNNRNFNVTVNNNTPDEANFFRNMH